MNVDTLVPVIVELPEVMLVTVELAVSVAALVIVCVEVDTIPEVKITLVAVDVASDVVVQKLV